MKALRTSAFLLLATTTLTPSPAFASALQGSVNLPAGLDQKTYCEILAKPHKEEYERYSASKKTLAQALEQALPALEKAAKAFTDLTQEEKALYHAVKVGDLPQFPQQSFKSLKGKIESRQSEIQSLSRCSPGFSLSVSSTCIKGSIEIARPEVEYQLQALAPQRPNGAPLDPGEITLLLRANKPEFSHTSTDYLGKSRIFYSAAPQQQVSLSIGARSLIEQGHAPSLQQLKVLAAQQIESALRLKPETEYLAERLPSSCAPKNPHLGQLTANAGNVEMIFKGQKDQALPQDPHPAKVFTSIVALPDPETGLPAQPAGAAPSSGVAR